MSTVLGFVLPPKGCLYGRGVRGLFGAMLSALLCQLSPSSPRWAQLLPWVHSVPGGDQSWGQGEALSQGAGPRDSGLCLLALANHLLSPQALALFQLGVWFGHTLRQTVQLHGQPHSHCLWNHSPHTLYLPDQAGVHAGGLRTRVGALQACTSGQLLSRPAPQVPWDPQPWVPFRRSCYSTNDLLSRTDHSPKALCAFSYFPHQGHSCELFL